MNTCIITADGTAFKARGKTIAILSICPVLLSILRIPAAAPRVCGSTELIIAFVFGEAKKPDPPPISTIYTDNNQYGVVGDRVDSQNKPIAEIAKPIGANKREPTRSDKRPLNGPIIINAAPNGASNKPAVRGSLP